MSKHQLLWCMFWTLTSSYNQSYLKLFSIWVALDMWAASFSLQEIEFFLTDWLFLCFWKQLLVYGAGVVVPSTFQEIEHGLVYSAIVMLSTQVPSGKATIVIAKRACADIAGNLFERSANSSFVIRFGTKVFLKTRYQCVFKVPLHLQVDWATPWLWNRFHMLLFTTCLCLYMYVNVLFCASFLCEQIEALLLSTSGQLFQILKF